MYYNVSLALVALFLAFLAGAALMEKIPFVVAGFYFAASVAAFAAYALDKLAAKNDRWRTPESTLHFFGLIGGWPGALLAQRLLRHKTKKTSFQFAFWVTVVLNCAALGWLLMSKGAESLRAVIGVG